MANISCVPFHFETRFTDSGSSIAEVLSVLSTTILLAKSVLSVFGTSVCSILFRMALAVSSTLDISSTSSVIAIFNINANRCGLFPHSSIDRFILVFVCVSHYTNTKQPETTN